MREEGGITPPWYGYRSTKLGAAQVTLAKSVPRTDARCRFRGGGGHHFSAKSAVAVSALDRVWEAVSVGKMTIGSLCQVGEQLNRSVRV